MILICFAGLALAGCGRDAGAGADVVATTAIAADIVRQVVGPDASVDDLLPPGASPHGYSVSAKERAELEDADLVVAWGSDLEDGLPLDGLEIFKLAEGEADPHVWMDPLRIADALPALASALARRDPDHAAEYRVRAERYGERLRRLHAEMRQTLARIPAPSRKLVTSHDALGHFARRYSFELVGSPFGRAPEAEASAERVADLIEAIRRENVAAVFAEDSDDPKLMRRIAEEAGVEVVDDLLIEGFGGSADSYEEMLRLDAQRIAAALAP